ncbi:MAG: nuclear transport factor 2 family protein [Woeseiaceae bacterium]
MLEAHGPGSTASAILLCMPRLILTIALLVLSASVLADPAEDVRCREIAFSNAAENRDMELFRSFLDSDARFVGSIVTRGPEEIVAAWQPFFSADGPTIRWRPQFVEVRDDGQLALTRGPYRMISMGPDGKPIEHWGTFNSVWRKNRDGDWQVIFDAGNIAEKPPQDETRALLDADDNCE